MTVYHNGNASVNINGSNCVLLYNQIYHLTIEATNIVGSTPSEEIQFCKSIVQTQGVIVHAKSIIEKLSAG